MNKDPMLGLSNKLYFIFSDYCDTTLNRKIRVQITNQTFFLMYERFVMRFSEQIEEQLRKEKNENTN